MRISPFYIKEYPDEYLRGMIKRETQIYKRGTLITISGSSYRKTGTGKSWTALRIGEMNDKDYKEGAKKVVYFISDFLKIMDEIEETKRIGQVVVIDEAGSMINAKQWQSIINKAVAYTVQTFRYLRCAVVLVMPQRRLIDKDVRTMADYHIEMEAIYKNGKNYYLSNPYALFYDEWDDRAYRMRLTGYLMKQRKFVWLKRIPIRPLQSERLIEEYEKLSKKYKKQLRELVADEIKSYEHSLRKTLRPGELDMIIDAILKNDAFFESIIKNRKIDKDLLAISLEKAFPNYKFETRTVNTIAKILKKRMMR